MIDFNLAIKNILISSLILFAIPLSFPSISDFKKLKKLLSRVILSLSCLIALIFLNLKYSSFHMPEKINGSLSQPVAQKIFGAYINKTYGFLTQDQKINLALGEIKEIINIPGPNRVIKKQILSTSDFTLKVIGEFDQAFCQIHSSHNTLNQWTHSGSCNIGEKSFMLAQTSN